MLGVRQESFHRWVTGLGRIAAVLGVRVLDWGECAVWACPPINDCVNKKKDGKGFTLGITTTAWLGTAKPLGGRWNESRKDKLHVFFGKV